MNEGRRKLFKAALFGGIGLIVGKFLSKQAFGFASQDGQSANVEKNIATKRDGDRVVFFDKKTGEEIFILDNEE